MNVGDQVRRTGGRMGDGQLGTVVETPEGMGVLLDRAAEKLVVPYHPQEWTPVTRAPLPLMHLARITYDADRALRVARGEYGAKEWPTLREQERVGWAQGGPPSDAAERRALYEAIRGALGE